MHRCSREPHGLRHIKEDGILIIGITGGVGCGKSTVLALLEKEFGAKIIISDDIGHEALSKGTWAYQKVCEQFGQHILEADGDVDRAALAELIYADDKKREQLNQIIHPYVYEEIEKRIGAWREEPLVVLETAILFETGCDKLCDEVWGVLTDKEIRIRRLRESRGYTREKAESIMSKQLPEEEWEKKCDHIIKNNDSQRKLLEQLQELLGRN